MLNALIPIVLLSLLITKMHRDQEYLRICMQIACLKPRVSIAIFKWENTGSIGVDQTKFQTKNVCRELGFIRR